MKIGKTARGHKIIKMSQSEWENINKDKTIRDELTHIYDDAIMENKFIGSLSNKILDYYDVQSSKDAVINKTNLNSMLDLLLYNFKNELFSLDEYKKDLRDQHGN